MLQEGQKTNLAHTPTAIRLLGQRWGWGQRLVLPPREAGTEVTAHKALVWAWAYLYTHKKRALNYTELGRNRIKAGGHAELAAVVLSKHFDVVFLQERALSGIIYLSDIKLAHHSSPKFLLNQNLLQPLLWQRCFLFQIIRRTVELGVHPLFVRHF